MVCEEDLELRREIEALLASHDKLEQGDQDFITPALITPALQAVNRIQLPHLWANTGSSKSWVAVAWGWSTWRSIRNMTRLR